MSLPYDIVFLYQLGIYRIVSTHLEFIMRIRKYTDEDVRSACARSYSYSQVLVKLNLKPAGGNHACLKKRIKDLSIDISHFTLKGWNKGIKFQPKRQIEDYLSNTQAIQSHKLKIRLIDEKVFTHICSNCGLSKWLDLPIPLELDHIDGNHLNNNLSNIRLLCPNCHALTPTYRGKNRHNKSI